MANGDQPSLGPSPVQQLNTRLQTQAASTTMQQQAKDADKVVTSGGTDPDYIHSVEQFLSMSHQEILTKLDGMKPGLMHTFADKWKQLGDAMMFNTMGLTAKVNKTLADGRLQGATADAIADASRQFGNQAGDLHNVTESVYLRIQSAAYGAETTKAAVPPLPAPLPAPNPPGAENPSAAIAQVSAVSEAEQAARMAMVNYYVPSYQPAGQQVPTYVPPTGPNRTPGASPSSPGSSPGTPGAPGTPGTAPGASNPGAGSNPDQSPTHPQSTPGDGNPASNTPGQQGNPSQSPTVTTPASAPTTTTPASANSVGTTPGGTTPGPNAPGIGTPGRPGGTGPGAGAGTPGTSSHGPGGPGRSVPGQPGAGSPLGGPIGTGRSSVMPGAPGTPGGMMPHGAKGKGEDDEKEHKGRPELLVHERNRADLIGPREPSVPPVLGADPGPPPDDWVDARQDPPQKGG